MQITIKLATDNAAYYNIHHSEIAAEVLAKVSQEIGSGHRQGTVRDVNGNVTGSWKLSLDNG